MIFIKNISGEIKQLHIHEFQIDEILDITQERIFWANNDDVIKAISSEEFQILDNNGIILGISNQINILKGSLPTQIQANTDIVCSWLCMKNFISTNPPCSIQYFEMPDKYFIWIEYRLQKLFIPALMKHTEDCTDFEDNYKVRCNINEAPKVRVTTCKIGRKLHDRYISFTTAYQDHYDNTDWNYDDYGDVTYKMYKWVEDERVLTTDGAEADETWIEFEPSWDYEVASGTLDIPTELGGGDINLWELHVVAVPDVPKLYGGSIELISNPRLKFRRGKSVTVDSSIHPAELLYSETQHTNKIRFIVAHPVGAQAEFQINLKLYK